MTFRGKNLILVVVILFTITANVATANEKLSFWDQQRKGANGDGGLPSDELFDAADADKWFQAAAAAGIEFIRLSPVTWRLQKQDFLLGTADDFRAIPEQDFLKLTTVLDLAQKYNVKVVLTMFSLPGARFRQDNNNQSDYRLWTDEKYQQQACNFWKSLAARLNDHPAIVGYNPLNEPHPARRDGIVAENADGFEEWLTRHKETTSDLNRFNRRIVKAIRSEDTENPIILDCWLHSSVEGFRYLTPVDDEAVLYAFHYYGPWTFSTYRINKQRFSYPDKMPVGESDETEAWTVENIRQDIQPVIEWAKRYQVPMSRIIAEEFGCDRRVSGAKDFLEDVLRVLDGEGWHWAFYSFRSPGWDGMDYELGTKKLGWKYWEEREKGVAHEDLIKRHDNPLWNVFKQELSQ